MPDYSKQRQRKTPPHASMAGLRRATGLTLDQVAAAVTDILEIKPPKKPINRGTISAIELGYRGASPAMLDAIAIAYGMEPGDLTTDYKPRLRSVPEAVGQ